MGRLLGADNQCLIGASVAISQLISQSPN